MIHDLQTSTMSYLITYQQCTNEISPETHWKAFSREFTATCRESYHKWYAPSIMFLDTSTKNYCKKRE